MLLQTLASLLAAAQADVAATTHNAIDSVVFASHFDLILTPESPPHCVLLRYRSNSPKQAAPHLTVVAVTMLKLLLGDPNARKLKRYQPIVTDINLLEEEIAPLSDDELRDAKPRRVPGAPGQCRQPGESATDSR